MGMNSALPQRRFQYVLFDLGNTLFYFEGAYDTVLLNGFQAVSRTLHQMGHINDEDHFTRLFTRNMESYYRERNITFIEQTSLVVLRRTLRDLMSAVIPPDHLRTAINALYAETESHWKIEADAVPMLETLRQEGYRLGIISNAADALDVNILIEKGHIGPYFDQIIISADFGLRKPHPKIFNKALSYWKALPSQTVMVGDTLNADISGAHTVNMPAVWITRRADKTCMDVNLFAIEPDASIATLAELPDLLRNWN